MERKGERKAGGFTLVELMVTVVISLIIVSSVGVLVADSSGWFSDNYSRIYSRPVVESLLARKTFQRIIRRSSRNGYWVSAGSDAIEVYYYSTPGSSLDRYAQFYTYDGDLRLETGTLNPKTILSNQLLCTNVSSCIFKTADSAAQMILVLDNGQYSRGAIISAVMHND